MIGAQPPARRPRRDFALLWLFLLGALLAQTGTGCSAPGPAPGEILSMPEDLDRVIRLSKAAYSDGVIIRGTVLVGGGFGDGMLHIPLATNRKDVKLLVRVPLSTYRAASQRLGGDLAGRTITFCGTLDRPAGKYYAIIVRDPSQIQPPEYMLEGLKELKN